MLLLEKFFHHVGFHIVGMAALSGEIDHSLNLVFLDKPAQETEPTTVGSHE